MDRTNNDAPADEAGEGSLDDRRIAEVQPAAFLAALEEHRAHFGAAHSLAVLVVRLDRFAHACATIGLHRAHLLRAQVKSRVAGLAAMPVVMQWLGHADLGLACVLPDNVENPDGLSRTIAEALNRPYQVDGFELFLSCSIGVAIDHPDAGTERHLQQAFDAMLQVNRRGGDGIGSAQRPAAPRLAALLSALPGAIERGELSLQLQPRATFSTGAITGYTVRLRWQHPVLGRVAPQDFLPAADAIGLMSEIGRWTLQQLLQLVRETKCVRGMTFTLLVSDSQLQSDEAIAMLRGAIEAHGISPGQICIEVPVGSVPDSPETSAKAAQLREAGVRIALNDFTDDEGSRRALLLVEPDLVTLDARNLGHARQKHDMTSALQAACRLATAHGAAVCVKGVETQVQLDLVRQWGCHIVQGYLLAQPFPAQWLAQTHAAIAERAARLLKP